jgi:hypothetical protein
MIGSPGSRCRGESSKYQLAPEMFELDRRRGESREPRIQSTEDRPTRLQHPTSIIKPVWPNFLWTDEH